MHEATHNPKTFWACALGEQLHWNEWAPILNAGGLMVAHIHSNRKCNHYSGPQLVWLLYSIDIGEKDLFGVFSVLHCSPSTSDVQLVLMCKGSPSLDGCSSGHSYSVTHLAELRKTLKSCVPLSLMILRAGRSIQHCFSGRKQGLWSPVRALSSHNSHEWH